ncbi:MAG: L-ribulose-5-phosphate 4-epimerase AraD [Bacteroidales bacterium]|jgi:L-ribulose-5-phosphate 4-epimerase
MLDELKKKVLQANLDLKTHGLIVRTWGNASGRDSKTGLIVIKPSGVSYKTIKVSDMVVIDPEGKVVEGKLKPSTDAPTHLHLYKQFPAVGGIVHTHSTYATAWAQAGKDIPPLGTTHADHFYGAVPCTRKLSAEEINEKYESNTGKVIVERVGVSDPLAVPAVLVNCHGPFCWGLGPEDAVSNAIALEEIARIAFYTVLLEKRDAIDKVLLDKHFGRKHGKGKYYGQTS